MTKAEIRFILKRLELAESALLVAVDKLPGIGDTPLPVYKASITGRLESVIDELQDIIDDLVDIRQDSQN